MWFCIHIVPHPQYGSALTSAVDIIYALFFSSQQNYINCEEHKLGHNAMSIVLKFVFFLYLGWNDNAVYLLIGVGDIRSICAATIILHVYIQSVLSIIDPRM